MSSIELTPARVFALKSALRLDYDEVKSSHITEALAYSPSWSRFNTRVPLSS
jgi:hypothetical protein